MLTLTVDAASSTAPFEQLRVQAVAQITDGSVLAGTKLPTVRGLADLLGLAPNTVAKAYRALEADGFIETRGRNGTFVSARGDAADQQAQLAAQAFVARTRALGIDDTTAVDYVKRAFDS